MNILGISCFYHDSAVSIIVNKDIIAAVQEERFTRKKHTPDFPINSIKYCLEETGLKIEESKYTELTNAGKSFLNSDKAKFFDSYETAKYISNKIITCLKND